MPDAVEIEITGQINGPSAAAACARISAVRHRGQALVIKLNSPGGLIFDALKIADEIEAHGSVVCIAGPDQCSSAALLILASSWHRRGYALARYLFHDAAPLRADALAVGRERLTASRLFELGADMRQADRLCVSRLARGFGCDASEIIRLDQNDVELNGFQMLRRNFIHEVIRG